MEQSLDELEELSDNIEDTEEKPVEKKEQSKDFNVQLIVAKHRIVW